MFDPKPSGKRTIQFKTKIFCLGNEPNFLHKRLKFLQSLLILIFASNLKLKDFLAQLFLYILLRFKALIIIQAILI